MTRLLGIDIGTTGTKVALLDPETGTVVARSLPVELRSDRDGHAEASVEEWWGNVCSLVPAVLEAAGTSAADVTAVATTGMVPAVVVGRDQHVLRRAILQNDARAVGEVEELAAEFVDLDLVALTGSPLSQQSVAPTLRWLARHEPDVWRNATWVVGSYDWLLHALGAPLHVEWNWALESGLYTTEGQPIGRLVDACGAAEVVPAIERSGAVVGQVSPSAAAATGLAPGTPLVVGGADHVLSAASAGLHVPGDVLVKLGGAGDVLVVADRPITDQRLYLDAHPDGRSWLPNGCMATSGSLLRWLQGVLGGMELAALDEQASARPPADLLCLPYFLGEKSPLHDPDLRGAFVGLHLGHDGADLHRAALEATAFGFQHHFEVFAELGLQPRRVLVTNGGSRSTLWKQIVADVVGFDLVPVVDHSGASLGAAVAAGIGVGVVGSWGEVATAVHHGDPIRHDPGRHSSYEDHYHRWRELAERVAPISHSLARRGRR